ncbi:MULTISPECIES: peptide deformylase [unclassified Motilimonas]|uniref:peptide deformylase n=1 Tax=Motilimonas TaxID=1914248 RepID=UPI001E64CACA|nr:MULTISPECIES: peptide deformylase [unclassified Motilimonas]MCE0556573.1 peptide deformylase [Motilimonas sp. E26]MDO6524860.1 peptide deformylase [Motilimonas sp. 1_MG-2023]
MALLEVLHFPDERLRTVAKPVAQVTPQIKQIVEDMFDTMYEEEGIGLAATQVNIHQRIVVIDVSEERNERLVLINPEIIETSGIETMEEGCLSVPDTRADVQRADHIKVRALNVDGETIEFEADELLAVCIQHEIDHLNGKLFIDYLSPLKRQRIRSKIEKAMRRG